MNRGCFGYRSSEKVRQWFLEFYYYFSFEIDDESFRIRKTLLSDFPSEYNIISLEYSKCPVFVKRFDLLKN